MESVAAAEIQGTTGGKREPCQAMNACSNWLDKRLFWWHTNAVGTEIYMGEEGGAGGW